MSDPVTPVAPVVEPVAPPVEPATDSTDWKAEARKWEQRSKENKTELDGLTPTLTAAQSRIAELEGKLTQVESEKNHAALVAQVAKDTGVPADVLRGSTVEELTAHAATLKEAFKPSAPYIAAQGAAPNSSGNNELREFTKKLFNKD